MRLLLLRHGQTHSNVSGALDTGAPGAGLTELGHAQAAAAGTVLADRGIEAIYCSTLTRTRQTAAPLADRLDLEPVALEGFREVRAGDLEMRTDDESALAYRHVVASWLLERDLSVRMPGAETGHEFLHRFDGAIEDIRAAGHRTALVVSHGAAIRTWVGLHLSGTDTERWHDQALQPLHNTGCIELDDEDDAAGEWRVVAWHNNPVGGDLLDDPGAADPTAR
ncbi:MAG TPA: histidine phosphatase family protein [Marmoricola sp.]